MPEPLITIERNERSRCVGMGDHDGAEYAAVHGSQLVLLALAGDRER